jgi:peroxidase
VQWLKDFEEYIASKRVFVRKGTAAFNHFAFFKSKKKARRLANEAANSILGSQALAKQFSLTPNQAGFGLGAFSIKGTILKDKCPTPDRCDRTQPYRTYNASCNNLQNPLWGTSGSPFERTLLPEYGDGIWTPKAAKSGESLPSARLVSINIVPDINNPSELDTHNVMQWGQFVDHDITHTPLFRLGNKNSSGIQCCTEDGSDPVEQIVFHPQCLPIGIPANDPFFRQHGQRCMNFVRSLPGPQASCTFGYAEQQNQITHLHDSSQVYGNDEEDALALREHRAGKMKTYKNREPSSKDLLPQVEERLAEDECAIDSRKQRSQNQKCFKAGDSRSNEHPGLTAYHTVWVREHNRLAGELAYLNPHWGDERLYQEARRILVAEMQHITYNEWLPIVLGTDYMDQLDILPVTHGHSNKYSATVNPTILNSFATAAFRFGHTLIQGMME